MQNVRATLIFICDISQVKNFILLGDIHKSIYFLSWKEQGAQLNLLAKDFSSLDCFATEFLIDGSTLSLIVSDEQKNIQVSILLMFIGAHVIHNHEFNYKDLDVHDSRLSGKFDWFSSAPTAGTYVSSFSFNSIF